MAQGRAGEVPDSAAGAKWLGYVQLRLEGWSRDAAAKQMGLGFAQCQRFDRGDLVRYRALWERFARGREPFATEERLGLAALVDPASRVGAVVEVLGGDVVEEDAGGVVARSVGGIGPRHLVAVQALEDFELFRERFFGRVSLPWHVEAAIMLRERLEAPEKQWVVMNVAPGVGKTTLLHDFGLWVTAKDRAVRGCNVSSVLQLAARQTARMRRSLERTHPPKAKDEEKQRGLAVDAVSTLARDYGPFKPATREVWRGEEFVVVQADGMSVVEKEPTWSSYGRDGGILGNRFGLMAADDIVTKKIMRSLLEQEALKEWWVDECEMRLEPGGLLALVGQRLGAADLYRFCKDMRVPLEDDEQTLVIVEPGMEDPRPRKYHQVIFPAHDVSKCQGEHGLGAPAQPDGCLLDPKRVPYRQFAAAMAADPIRAATIYQQEDAAPGSTLVDRAWANGGTDSDGFDHPGSWDPGRGLWQVPSEVRGVNVVSVDPSGTKWWAVQAWVFEPAPRVKGDDDHLAGTRWLLDVANRQMEAPDLLDWNARDQVWSGVLEEWRRNFAEIGRHLDVVIVEQNAAQRYLLQYEHVRRWRQRHRVNILPHTTGVLKLDKDLGVWSCGPQWRYGRINLPGGDVRSRAQVAPLVNQVCSWPGVAREDQVMAHWFVEVNIPKLRSFRREDEPRAPQRRPSWLNRGR